MILISHRGNINGKVQDSENQPNYIEAALIEGFEVEIDVWYINQELFLGHDSPEHKINLNWLLDNKSKLWIHCKNIESMYFFHENKLPVNYFWHQEDDVTITSLGYFWTYPGKQLTPNSIAVLPELIHFENIEKCLGICSDYISKYRK